MQREPYTELFKRLSENWSLFRLKREEKKPAEKWGPFKKHKRTFEEIRFRPGENAAVVCGPISGVLGLDIDNEERFIETIEQNGWDLPDTFTVRTGSGGRHLYYQHPDDGKKYRNRSIKKYGFDVRGDGGYLTAPGSIHPNGNPYVIERDVPLSPAPEWLLEVAAGEGKVTSRKAGKTSQPAGHTTVQLEPVDIQTLRVSEKTRSLIQEGEPKGQRSEAIGAVLCALARAGLSDGQIFWIFENFPIGEKHREHSDTAWLTSEIERAREYIDSGEAYFPKAQSCSFESHRKAFQEFREKQAKLFGKALTPVDIAVNEVIFSASMAAINDVRNPKPDTISLRAVSLETGTGKSTSAYALIAACASVDPDFSCAYIVPTVRMGIEVQEGIEALLGEGSTTLWTSYHAHKGRSEVDALRELGFLPSRTIDKTTLPDQRIIIVTHKLWSCELKSGKDIGCSRFQGRRRDIIYVDEHPELVEIVSAQPHDVQEFHDVVASVDSEHPWLPVLSSVVSRMNEIMQTNCQRYVPTGVIGKEEAGCFSEASREQLYRFSNVEHSSERRCAVADQLVELVRFLRAASNGTAFFSHQDKTFFAYEMEFDRGAGILLLDATADIGGLVTLHPKVKAVEVPSVDFSNLEVFHIDQPRKFKNVSRVVKRADTGAEYGKWIKEMVMASTEPGDEVLVVTHKDVLNLHFIDSSDAPDNPLDWSGRKVNTQNWGAGIGLNKFKHKTHVFLFGEFYPKRSKTISDVHGWSGVQLSESTLKDAEGVRQAGDEYAPKGIYLGPYEGHLLRWQKQLSMRGAARNIDESGKCGKMKLFTCMDKNRLIRHFDRLFPGALAPVSVKAKAGTVVELRGITGRRGLIDLLMKCDKAIIGADEIERATGIKVRNLSREFKSDAVRDAAAAYKWRLVAAKDVGKAGRMKYLVNDPLRDREIYAKAVS